MNSKEKNAVDKSIRSAKAKENAHAAKTIEYIGDGLLAVAGIFGAPAFAQENQSGMHSVDALIQGALGQHRVQLKDGTVFGTPIVDATADFNLYRVGTEIGLIISGGGLVGSLDFELEKVAKADALDFGDAELGISLTDIGKFSGCFNVSELQQYFGTGQMINADGQSIPATTRFYMWLGTEQIEGASEQRTKLFAVGVVRSQILNGRFYVI